MLRIRLVHIMAVLTAAALIFMYRGTLDRVDYFLQDQLMQQEDTIDTRIAIIAIDDESISDFGSWPWNRHISAQLIDILSEGNPSVLAFDVTFQAPSADDADADQALVEAVRNAGNVIMPAIGTFPPYAEQGMIEALQLTEPFEALKEASAAIGHINTIPDRDRVVRNSLYGFL